METTMGLDMYALTLTQRPATDVDFRIGQADEIHSWRKHPDLHGWMEGLYRAKGGKREDFNCTAVLLTPEDLDRLEQDIQHRRLPSTCGFEQDDDLGESSDLEQDDDLLFISKARKAIEAGKTVVYTSWW
jgi:hypothetical protein